ncbi:MAG: hypothetical protein B7Y07_08485 [Halothiobacillus sp. 24-54-40]|jgi:type IV pilus assembly protein PilX|nr:MAG: hypothetical protein B7X12_06125 [Halothiobacillus sp. 20-53-49]OYY36173.1 MAG: hypothetical protein B7Y58_07180 [Halothiobacillus sp. 35-54-62]OYZ86328.1 MAG: hypothetical protein B7Y07_08485 [Halothiobacillus sp. 24-54-40]OZA80070.1 MAG: hypothetical protein B7X64_07440 [Halothiobacillus sp. 39-53-45]
MFTLKNTRYHPQASKQGGVALVVALVLLVLVTLVGLAAIRGTTMQQQMTSNFYDRETAFQSSEAALRVAASIVSTTPNATFIRNCSPTSGNACLGNPYIDPSLPANAIQNVVSGSGVGQFSAGAVAASQPQYIIENMGVFADPTLNPNALLTSNSLQYDEGVGSGGSAAASASSTYFRITARSGDPATIGDRSIVTLQAMVKQ